MEIKLFTIGFTQKSAREFFAALKEAGVKRVVDVRLNNNSQLAGFSKKEDLSYFLKEIGDIDYVHLPDLAPTQDILDAYKKQKGDWNIYERQFLDLMARREIERKYGRNCFNRGASFAVSTCRITAIVVSLPITSTPSGVELRRSIWSDASGANSPPLVTIDPRFHRPFAVRPVASGPVDGCRFIVD